MRISYWSSDVCSSDLPLEDPGHGLHVVGQHLGMALEDLLEEVRLAVEVRDQVLDTGAGVELMDLPHGLGIEPRSTVGKVVASDAGRSGEHTSELQSLMRISFAVFCLNTKTYSRLIIRTTIN